MVVFTYRIEYKYGDTIKIKPLFDVHYGNTDCDINAAKQYLAEKDDKNTYIIGGGDLIDSIVVPDIRYRKSQDAMKEDAAIIDRQVEGIEKILNPYKDRIIGLACLSDDTLILTENGWKEYNKLIVGENILSLDTVNECFEYQPVKQIYKYAVANTELYNLKGICQDQLVTKDHWVLRYNTSLTSWKKNYRESTHANFKGKYIYNIPEALPSCLKNLRIPVSFPYHGGNLHINSSLVKLIGWIITEGSFLKGNNGDGIYIYQAIKSKDAIDEIIECLQNLNFEYNIERKKYNNRRTRESEWIAIYIKAKHGKYIRNILNSKNITKNMLNDWDYESLCLLRDTMMKGDGSTRKMNDGSIQKTYYTANKNLALQFIELCLKTGIPATFHKRERTQTFKGYNEPVKTIEYSINLLANKLKGINSIKKIPYTGVVFDLNISKNKNFVAMRNGKPFVTGNSGNHEANIIRKCGTDPIARLSKLLECKNLGYSGLIRLTLREKTGRGRVVTIRFHHGWGGGSRTQGADLTKFSKDLQYWQADIFLYGHVHRLQSDRVPRLGLSGEELISKPKILCICGTFLKTYSKGIDSTYSEEKGYPPVEVGGLVVNVKPTERWVEIKVDV